MNSENGRLGILVGGGPAPGINSAISACAIEAASNGMQLYLSEGCAAIWKPAGQSWECDVEDLRPSRRIH